MLRIIKKYQVLLGWIFIIICVFWNVNEGFDLSDTGYSLVPYMNPSLRAGATWGASFFGSIIYSLGITSVLGIRIVFEILILIACLALWYASWDNMNKLVSALAIGAGIMISHYFPHTIGYIFLSQIVAIFCGICVYKGLINNKKILLLIAGVFYGFNIYIRFPNLCYIIVFVSIIIWFFIAKKSIKGLIGDIVFSAGGACIGLLIGLFVLIKNGQVHNYINSLFGLKELGQSNNSHNLSTLLQKTVNGNLTIIEYGALLILLGIGMIIIFNFSISNYIKVIMCILMSALAFGIIIYDTRFFPILNIISGISIVACVIQSVFGNNKMKLYSIILLFLFIGTPLGSDNGTAYYVSCMHIALPVLFYTVLQLLRNNGKIFQISFQGIRIIKVYVSIICVALFLLVLPSAILFPYRDCSIVKTNTVLQIDKMKGIQTTERKAKYCTELVEFLDKQESAYDEIITYGSIPMIGYLVEKPSAISTSWCDLLSYSLEQMEYDLEQIENKDKVYIILAKSDAQAYDWDKESRAHKALIKKGERSEKCDLLLKYIKDNDFHYIYNDEYFTVYAIE